MEICIILPKKERKPLKVDYRVYKNLTYCLGVAIAQCNNLMAEVVDPMDRLDVAGEKMMHYGTRIGYWVCIVMALVEIVKALINGDVNAIWGIIIKYGTAFGGIFLLKFMMDLIMGVFAV